MPDQGDLGKALVWQIVFGSGVFLEEHPDRAEDRDAYMLAGLESAVRAYRNARAKDPKKQIQVFEELDALEQQGRLPGPRPRAQLREERLRHRRPSRESSASPGTNRYQGW